MIVICLEGTHGAGKSALVESFKEIGYTTLDEGFMDMPKTNLHPQNVVCEMLWMSKWFERLLQIQKAYDDKNKDKAELEEPVFIADRSPFSAIFYAKDNKGHLLEDIMEQTIKELRAAANIRIYTVHIAVDKDILWNRIQTRLSAEPFRKQYGEDKREWMDAVCDFYENRIWDYTVENNKNSIVDVRDTIIRMFTRTIQDFTESSPRGVKEICRSPPPPPEIEPRCLRNTPLSPVRTKKRMSISIGVQALSFQALANVAYSKCMVIIEAASLKALPTDKDKAVAKLPASVEVAENDMMDIGVVRAIMLARIQSLLSAKNVRAEIVEVMGKILNAGFAPVVSASTPSPLVAIAQGISGKFVNDKGIIKTFAEMQETIAEADRFSAVVIGEREMNAFVRGTLILSTLAALSYYSLEFLTNIGDCVASMTCEAVSAFTAPFDAIHHDENRPHKGAVLTASQLRLLLESSKFADSGVARDALSHANRLTQIELNSFEGGKVSTKNDSLGEYVSEPALLGLTEMSKALVVVLSNCLARIKLLVNNPESMGLPKGLLFEGCAPDMYTSFLSNKWLHDCEECIEKCKKFSGLTSVSDPASAQYEFAWAVFNGTKSFHAALAAEYTIAYNAVVYKESKAKEKKAKKGKEDDSSYVGQGNTQFRRRLNIVTPITTSEALVAGQASVLKSISQSNNELTSWLKSFLAMSSSTRKPKLAKGTKDYDGAQMVIREKAFNIIKSVFEKHGAVTIDTPVFELKETLMGKYGDEAKLIYELADQGGELLALRYDLTVPFARYLAMNPGNIKRYHIAKVYRRDNPAMNKGRFREFYQCDFDIAGTYGPMVPDAEVVRVVTDILSALDVGSYVVKLSHRGLLDAMVEMAGIPKEKFNMTCSSVDKLDKEPWEVVRKELIEEKGISEQSADFLGNYVVLKDKPRELLNLLRERKMFDASPRGTQALVDMDLLFSYLDAMNALDNLSFDLSLARGLDYYTGLIYEAVLTKAGVQVGSIAGGGRYDKLVGLFSNKDIPAVGVSIGIERIFTILEEKIRAQGGIMRDNKSQVFVASQEKDAELFKERLRICNLLWQNSVATEFAYTETKVLGKQLITALEKYIPVAVLVMKGADGPVYHIKNLIKQEQREVQMSNLVEEVKKEIEACAGLDFKPVVPAGGDKDE